MFPPTNFDVSAIYDIARNNLICLPSAALRATNIAYHKFYRVTSFCNIVRNKFYRVSTPSTFHNIALSATNYTIWLPSATLRIK